MNLSLNSYWNLLSSHIRPQRGRFFMLAALLFGSIGLPATTTKVMMAHFGEEERNYCLGVASQLRAAGINTEIYPDVTKKISRQFDYANKRQIPHVIVIGGEEMKTGELAFKNMATGEQIKMKTEQIIQKLTS